MSKPKPTRRRTHSNQPDDSVSSQPNANESGGRFSAIIFAVLALVAAIGLILFLNRSVPSTPPVDFATSFPTKPAELSGKGYAGPAAFTFTTENAALSPDGGTTAWSYQGNDVVMCVGVFTSPTADMSQQITLTGHNGPIRALAFAPFGQSLASASADHTVKIWDVASGEEMMALEGHTDEVTSVAFSPDGVSMATGGADMSIRLWDAYGGLPLTTLDGHAGTVTALAYSADGNLLASASEDKSIKVWDMETGQELAKIESGNQPIRSMVFSPTQEVLATTDGESLVRLWNAHDGTELSRIDLHDSEVLSAAFSPDGTAIAVAGFDGKILVTVPSTGATLADFVTTDTPIFVEYSADNTLRWSRFQFDDLTEIAATTLAARIAIKNHAPENAIVGFGKPDGFQVELFANELLVSNPAAICFDEQGRLYVAETFRFDTEVGLGYTGREIWLLDDLANQTPSDRLAMYEKYQYDMPGGMHAHRKFSERVRCLVDSTGDGRADRSTIFAEGFDQPLTGTGTGLISRDGALYYTCIPDLWRLVDQDNDLVADQRESIVSGFGVNASLPHGLHGLAFGPDGKLYFSIGDRGFHIETKEGNTLHLPAIGAVLRCNPDGSELEEVARGFRNPQELAFDKFGNLFTCDNNSNLGDKARLVYVVPGGDSGWHMSYETMPVDYPLGPWNMDRIWETFDAGAPAWTVPPVAYVGSGPAGLTYYPGVGLPQRYDGHFFLCDFADAPEVSGIRSFAVKANGAGFEINDEHTFLSNVLPTDVEFGLDQKMYFSDWIRGATSDGLGRIYTVFHPKSIVAESVEKTHELFSTGFARLTIQEQIELLRHQDMRVRQRAQFALANRGIEAIDPLKSVAAGSESQLPRLHAMWALGMIGRHDATALEPIRKLMADADPEIRAQTAKVLGEGRDQAAAAQLIGLLQDDSLRVRAFAAHALGRIAHQPAIGPILDMLRENGDQDPFLRHAGVYALFGIGDAETVAAYSTNDDRSVRMAVLLTLRRFKDPRMSQFLNDTEPSIALEAARAIHDLPIEAAMNDLAEMISLGGENESLLRRVINANYRFGTENNARALTDFIGKAASSDAMKVEAIRSLGDWTSPPRRDRVLGFVRAMPQRSGDAVENVIAPWLAQMMQTPGSAFEIELMQAASKLKIQIGDVAWISDPKRAVEVRTKLLDMMAERNDDRTILAINAAIETDEPLLRVHAAGLLARLDPTRAIDALTKILTDGTTAEKQFAFTAFAEIESPRVDAILSDWLLKIPAGEVPPPLKQEILSSANQRNSPQVRQAMSTVFQFLSQQSTVAGKYQSLLEGGSAERGKALFENHTEAQCIRCHTVNGKGGKVGPDLSTIGNKFSREYLLESLLAPESKIAEGYEGVIVSTVDGRILSGTLQQEDDQQIRFVDNNGKPLVIAKADIVQRQSGKSAMPNNLLQLISSDDVRDVVEYLANLK